jgi:hypothetical protein
VRELTIAKLQHERFGPSSKRASSATSIRAHGSTGVLARIADRPASKRAKVLLAAGVHTGAGYG